MDVQTVFAILVGGALACFSLVMVGYSFFRGTEPRIGDAYPVSLPEEDGVGMDATIDSIDTLELEYQLGNVPEEQYHQQLQSYRLQLAIAVREQLERGDSSPELALEQEVLRVRAEGGGRWQSCPQCDAPLPVLSEVDSPFPNCPHCNAVLPVRNAASAQDAAAPGFQTQGQ